MVKRIFQKKTSRFAAAQKIIIAHENTCAGSGLIAGLWLCGVLAVMPCSAAHAGWFDDDAPAPAAPAAAATPPPEIAQKTSAPQWLGQPPLLPRSATVIPAKSLSYIPVVSGPVAPPNPAILPAPAIADNKPVIETVPAAESSEVISNAAAAAPAAANGNSSIAAPIAESKSVTEMAPAAESSEIISNAAPASSITANSNLSVASPVAPAPPPQILSEAKDVRSVLPMNGATNASDAAVESSKNSDNVPMPVEVTRTWSRQLETLEAENQALRARLHMGESDPLADIKVDAVAQIHDDVFRARIAELEKEVDKLSMKHDNDLPQKTSGLVPAAPAKKNSSSSF